MLKRLRNLTSPPVIEQRAALLAGKNIAYTLKRSHRRRSIGLRIDDRGLTVSVPLRTSEKWLNNVLQDKALWVVEKLDGWQQPSEMRWADGENIQYLGESLTLCVQKGLFTAPAQRRSSELWVFVDHDSEAAQIERAVACWHQQEAERIYAERVAHYAVLLKVMPLVVRLSSAKMQWGCCTARGTVRLNKKLIELPLRLIDYVVVHELAHLREMNHSAAFWRVVGTACPDYLGLRRELRACRL